MLAVVASQICTALDAYGCTKCSDIPGVYEIYTEHKLICVCQDRSQMIYKNENGLECYPVERGYHVDNVTFQLLPTNCSSIYYNYMEDECYTCDEPFATRFANGLCVKDEGVVKINDVHTCYLGYGEKYEDTLKCESCPPGSYTVEINGHRRCSMCQLNEFRYGDKCLEYTNENCQKLNAQMTARPLSCICPDGKLPVMDLKKKAFSCGESCSNPIHYIGHGIPSNICRYTGKTILNTTCKNSYLDTRTGLCTCEDWVTADELDTEGIKTGYSICLPSLLYSYRSKHCNENGLFHGMYQADSQSAEGIFCAQSAIPWRICDVYQSANCTPCSNIDGATNYESETRIVCYCTNNKHLIYEKDFKLQCAEVPPGYRVNHTTYQLVPEGEWKCAYYWDVKNNVCTVCNEDGDVGAIQYVEETKACIVQDGLSNQEGWKCALGFIPIKDNDQQVIGCEKCGPGLQTVVMGTTQVCSKCCNKQFRYIAWCFDFSDETCGLMGKGLFANRQKTQCIWGRGSLPVYSLKVKMNLLKDCEDSDYSYYNGQGIPAKICRYHGKTIYNTTCPDKYPLNTTTGLCSCPEGQATVVYFYADKTPASISLCRPVYLKSEHLQSCNKNSIFIFQHLGKPEAYCMQRGDLSVFKQQLFLSEGEIAGIAIGAILLVAIVAVAIWLPIYLKRRKGVAKDVTKVAPDQSGPYVDAQLMI